MEQLKALLKEGVTAAHTIQFVKDRLVEQGFIELQMKEKWNLAEGHKYYVNLYGTNMVAFCVGTGLTENVGFHILMAHSDYPTFQIKPNPLLPGGYTTRWNVDIYGGMYQKSWLDRPLGVAGTVMIEGRDAYHPVRRLYCSDRPLAVIPSLAIHMDRELNKKGALEVAKELVPLAGISKDCDLLSEIADALAIQKETIIDYDLYLYNMDMPVMVGLDQGLLSSPRLDNLTSVAAGLYGLVNCGNAKDRVNMLAIFDNEEVGSLSKQGADSELLSMVLSKIGRALLGRDYQLSDSLTDSFLLSADVAHASHPNYEEKNDATNKAQLGQGFCIKRSVGQKYGTTAESSAVLRQLCEKNSIPYTIAINKTGIPGGSTLGPIVTSHLPFSCADIGLPILAMHSATELCAAGDYKALKKIVQIFYE